MDEMKIIIEKDNNNFEERKLKSDLIILRDFKEEIKEIIYEKRRINFYIHKQKIYDELKDLVFSSSSLPYQQSSNHIETSTINLFQNIEPLKERVIYEVQDKLFSDEFLYKATDLSFDQINHFFKIIIIDVLFYKKYVSPDNADYNLFKDLFDNLLKLAISKNRQSRKEIIDLFQRLKLETEKIKEVQTI